MGFFYVQPEVAGAGASGLPSSPVCVFDTWLGDDLVRAHPLFLVTTPLMRALRALENPSGFSMARVRIRSSPFFRRYSPKRRLPVFWSIRAGGSPGCADVAVTVDGSLVVSQRVLEIFMEFRVERAVFAQHSKGTGALAPRRRIGSVCSPGNGA